MPVLLVGTNDGLHTLDLGDELTLKGHEVTSIIHRGGTSWAIADNRQLWQRANGQWRHAGSFVGEKAQCLLPLDDELLVGTAGARLLRLKGRNLDDVPGFDRIQGRDRWYTPWGGPPDTRSLTTDGRSIYAGVHVGGIVRSDDGGRTWTPTALDIDADVHQVLSHPDAGLVLAACAVGLASSADRGESWTTADQGLHAAYLRAVAVSGGTVIVSASEGPDGGRSCLYRRPLGGAAPFVKCEGGLPTWFDDNIDTGCLDARGPVVVVGAPDGTIYLSADAGVNWHPVSIGLPRVRCLAIE